MRILFALALLLAGCADEDAAPDAAPDAALDGPQCRFLPDDCARCRAVPPSYACDIRCPDAPPNEWCPLIGGTHDFCCTCADNHWHNVALDCLLWAPDAAAD